MAVLQPLQASVPPPPQPDRPQEGVQHRFNQPPPAGCYSTFLSLVEVVAQLAIRGIFIVANILMTAALAPLSWHWLVLPMAAIGSTAIAGFFFPNATLIESNGNIMKAQRPVRLAENGLYPNHYPIGSPVGYHRLGQNCAFNAALHFLDSDPETAAWVRRPPVADAINLENFLQYLQHIESPRQLNTAFQEYVAAQPAGRQTIPALFAQFLTQYQPPAGIQLQSRKIRAIYHLFHTVLPDFFRANDAAVRERRAVSTGRSEEVRREVSAFSDTISASNVAQTDAGEIDTHILDFAPNDLKICVERVYDYNTEGLPPIAQPRASLRSRESILSLPLDRETPDGTPLQALLQAALRNTSVESQRQMGTDHQAHDYPVNHVLTKFMEKPKVLRFQMNRFRTELDPPGTLEGMLPGAQASPRWRGIKLDTRIACPDEISIHVEGMGDVRYKLSGLVTHQGSFGSGHYLSGQQLNGHKYLHNDSHVTYVQSPEDLAAWQQALDSAYLLCYVPVEEDPAPQPAQ